MRGSLAEIFASFSTAARGSADGSPGSAVIRMLGHYYGDSGIFVSRSVYGALGGFRPMPVMEDREFVRRLERFGRTTRIKDPPLITSSRRFEGRRAVEIVYGWVGLHALYWLGVSPDRLAEIYETHAPSAAERQFPLPRASGRCSAVDRRSSTLP